MKQLGQFLLWAYSNFPQDAFMLGVELFPRQSCPRTLATNLAIT